MSQQSVLLFVVLLAFGQISQGLLLPSCYTGPITPSCTRDPSLITPTLPTCSVSIDSFINGRTVPGNSWRPSSNPLPSWVNYALARRGQQVSLDRIYSGIIGVLFGVLNELNMPDVRNVLMFTNHSGTFTNNAKRDLSTAAQGIVWMSDPFIGPPAPLSWNLQNFVASIKNVRERHINATTRANAKMEADGVLTNPDLYMNTPTNDGLWAAFNLDLQGSTILPASRAPPPSHWTNISALIFNQQAMAFVQYNLLAFPILFPDQLGLFACDADLTALNHLFAVIGYALGVDNEYNLCLQEDITAVKAMYRQVFNTYIIPSLFQFDKQTYVMLDNVLGGIGQVTQGLFTPQLILYRFLKYMVNIEAPNLYGLLSDADKGTNSFVDGTVLPELMKNPVYRTTLSETIQTFLLGVGTAYYPGVYDTNYSKARWAFSPDP